MTAAEFAALAYALVALHNSRIPANGASYPYVLSDRMLQNAWEYYESILVERVEPAGPVDQSKEARRALSFVGVHVNVD